LQVIAEWTGQELTQCSLYGIRVYKNGAILAPHVDRLPLVSSAIINVAQDLDEPWPLEVIGHDGKATNVTMEAGDMVLYESHSIIHGRPFPLKGRFMANIFVHFEPTGHSLRHNIKHEEEAGGDVEEKYRKTAERGIGGHESDNSDLPPYIKDGSPEADHWRQLHPHGETSRQQTFTTGSTPVHLAAKDGDVKLLHQEILKKKDAVNAKDINGWTPLHEGARGGHLEVVKLLVENGADVSARTGAEGGTALWWAKQTHGKDNEVVHFLEEIGALDIGPEL
jgi:prolyl 4-hydroxylase